MSSAAPLLNDDFARCFASKKQDFVSTDGIRQTGAACLAQSPSPVEWPLDLTASEPRIETFVLPNAQTWSVEGMLSTGPDAGFATAWSAAAETMAATVLAAAGDHEVRIVGPGYLTVSVTPSPQVEGLAHLDDDMYTPGDGVGLVAICGSQGGPRVATGTVPHPPVMAPTQLAVNEAIIEAFTAGEMPHQQAAPDQIVVFPQFGQLHAGPPLATAADASPNLLRHLMVLRCTTAPS